MTDPTRSALVEIATPALYRRNAFRITGLPTDADRRTVRQRQQRVNTMLEIGADIDLGREDPVDPREVARAFDLILGDPRRRLVDELFWWWDTPGATCGCPQAVHRAHDAAVRAHSAALDRELAGGDLADAERAAIDKLWSEAGRRWHKEVRRLEFWNHVRHRIRELDDKQLDESVIEVLRDQIAIVLLKPLIQLAATPGDEQTRLADHARNWPAPQAVATDLLEEAAEPMYRAVHADVMKASERLRAGAVRDAASMVYRQIMPTIRRLDVLVPPATHRRTATLRNDVAILLNNCATTLIEDVGPRADRFGHKWLRKARNLASDPHTVAMIDKNAATLTDIVTAFATITERVDELVAIGRPDLAKRMLRSFRREMADAPGVGEIDRMIENLGGRVPSSRRGGYERPTFRTRRIGRFFDALGDAIPAWAFWVVIALGAYWYFFTGDEEPVPVSVFSDVVASNAPVGTCVATREGWQGDKARVPSVPCDQEHWGQIVGYVELGSAPSPYPGDEVVQQQTMFRCASQQGRHGPRSPEYTTDHVRPDVQRWNTGGETSENYATCVLHRVDDKPLPERSLVDADREATDYVVTASMFSWDIGTNVPVGSCVESRQSYERDLSKVSFSACDRPHWGEVLGYPVLYEPNTPWPGDAAVHAAADAACQKIAADRGLGPAYRVHVTWPGSSWWTNAPAKRKYAVCTASTTDGAPLTGWLP